MYDRRYRTVAAPILEQKLRDVFNQHREIFEELVIRGWSVDLILPTNDTTLGYGYVPGSLADNAGFVVNRSITPEIVHRLVEDLPAAREVFR